VLKSSKPQISEVVVTATVVTLLFNLVGQSDPAKPSPMIGIHMSLSRVLAA
jgi:hypothetical protein